MARQRSAPRPKPAPAARAAPPPRQSAPPPAAHHAPPPAMPQSSGGGGGFMSGLMGSVAQGAALGTGSALAHRAVDSMMGPRGGHGEAAPAEPAAAAPAGYAQAPPAQYGSPEEARCAAQAKAFAECMSRAAGDMGACQFYFESMQACKRGDAFMSG